MYVSRLRKLAEQRRHWDGPSIKNAMSAHCQKGPMLQRWNLLGSGDRMYNRAIDNAINIHLPYQTGAAVLASFLEGSDYEFSALASC